MKKILLFFWSFLLCFFSFAQGLNNLWLMGYNSADSLPYGGTNIDFSTGIANVYYNYRNIGYRSTHANITNQLGMLLFSSNGINVADSTGNTMQYGDGLNPSRYTTDMSDIGLHIPQANLILPKPGSSSIYYLFHCTVDDDYRAVPATKYIYLTTVDMSLNNGLGAVVSKNEVLLTDKLNVGKIVAVKHANGRDWWVVCHRVDSNTYFKFLVTPEGIAAPETQSIGTIRPPDVGQATFSPDGSLYAYYYPLGDLEVMNFDRCSGMFSNPSFVAINDSAFGGGVAFSPNSRVLYVSSTNYVYQFDLTTPNIAASKQTVAVWDGFYSPGPPFATMFSQAKLAPDGKIYITTGNSTLHLHVINSPDNLGVACNMVQHGLQLPTYNSDTSPNHPNYHLGALAGSPCDTLLAAPEALPAINLQLYPNPNQGEFTLSFAPQSTSGLLQLYNVQGRLVHQELVSAWSQVKRLSLPALQPGMYLCRLSWGAKTVVARFVKE